MGMGAGRALGIPSLLRGLVLVGLLLAAPAASAAVDLVVTNIVLDPAGAGAGKGKLVGTVKNIGSSDGSFFVTINVTMFRDGIKCDEGAFYTGFDAGESANEDSTACVPDKPGTYAITYVVDTEDVDFVVSPAGVVTYTGATEGDEKESNETNNWLTKQITWTGPDLVITKIELLSSPVKYGEGTLRATVKNQGSVATATLINIDVKMYLDGEECDTGIFITGFDAGESATEDTTTCNPSTPGLHTVKFVVDWTSEVPETDETNNSLEKTFTWYAPDLVITDLELEGQPAHAGEGKLVATIENQGLIDTATLLNIDVTMFLDGVECDTGIVIAGLGAGNDATEESTKCNPMTDGPHTIEFVVDSTSEVVEMDESNNSLEKTFEWYLPDLYVTDIVFDGDKPLPGEDNKFIATVKNKGLVPTQTFVNIDISMFLDDELCDTGLIIAGLDEGESATEATTSCNPTTPGPHVLRFEVDTKGDVWEGDETNNAYEEVFVFCADAELCNGYDDDCDGATDEDWPDLGQACDGPDADLCQAGQIICTEHGEAAGCVEDPGSGELCNGLDDDCDGATDEDWPALGDPCDGDDSDACTDGQWACAADGAGAECTDDAAGAEELCNGLDDDCDWSVDETWPEVGEACLVAQGGCEVPGKQVCADDGLSAVCEPTGEKPAELCNGLDDDCDGSTDETFPYLGAPCHAGEGACQAWGEVVCGPSGEGPICDAAPLAPGAESCGDGVDDDCDGLVDEGCPCEAGTFVACGVDVGACEAGVQVCLPGGTLSDDCGGVVGPGPEVCNGQDDDCDASVDEGCPCTQGGSHACAPGAGVCAEEGLQMCVGGHWGACQGAAVFADESCDGQDDDCDGLVDEGCDCAPGAIEPCLAPPEACADYERECGPDGSWSVCAPVPGTEKPGCEPVQPPVDEGPAEPVAELVPDSGSAPPDAGTPGTDGAATTGDASADGGWAIWDAGEGPADDDGKSRKKGGCGAGPRPVTSLLWLLAAALGAWVVRRRS